MQSCMVFRCVYRSRTKLKKVLYTVRFLVETLLVCEHVAVFHGPFNLYGILFKPVRLQYELPFVCERCVFGILQTLFESDVHRSFFFYSCKVTVPFASIMLENCMPLLVSRGLWDPAAALPGPPGPASVACIGTDLLLLSTLIPNYIYI